MGAKKIIDPFQVTKSKAKSSGSKSAELSAPQEVSTSVDDYARIHKQIKSLEAEKEQCKDTIQAFAQEQYAQRVLKGVKGNFKVCGDESAVYYITMGRGSSINGEEYEELCGKWGTEKVEACVAKDMGSVRFDAEVYHAHQDTINEAIADLIEKIGVNPFTAPVYKVKSDILDILPTQVDNSKDLENLVDDLKITTQLRVAR